MFMNLLSPKGKRTEAVLLAGGSDQMRIVFSGLKDTTEMRLIEDRWISENGNAVDIELLISIPATNIERSRIVTAGS